MSYSATVFNVMIASPGDVLSERAIVREVIYEWNAVHSKKRNIVLLPLGWETHSSPEMGNSAQSIINNQVLEKCDLLIGVFWTRLGTATVSYASGTVEEIEKHILSGRPAMLYFSSQPASLDTVDIKQLAELKSFKDSCRGRGLYESYDSYSDFKNKFYRHLQLKLNEHSLFNNSVEKGVSLDFIVEAKSTLPSLTNEEKILLKEGSQDSHGTIVLLNFIGGASIQTNGKEFGNGLSHREMVKWESALKNLVEKKILSSTGFKGEVFEVTEYGYQIADMINL